MWPWPNISDVDNYFETDFLYRSNCCPVRLEKHRNVGVPLIAQLTVNPEVFSSNFMKRKGSHFKSNYKKSLLDPNQLFPFIKLSSFQDLGIPLFPKWVKQCLCKRVLPKYQFLVRFLRLLQRVSQTEEGFSIKFLVLQFSHLIFQTCKESLENA